MCDLREVATLSFLFCAMWLLLLSFLLLLRLARSPNMLSCCIGAVKINGRCGRFTCMAKIWRSIMVGRSDNKIKTLPSFTFPYFFFVIFFVFSSSSLHSIRHSPTISAFIQFCHLILETWLDFFILHRPFRLFLPDCSASSHSYPSFHPLR